MLPCHKKKGSWRIPLQGTCRAHANSAPLPATPAERIPSMGAAAADPTLGPGRYLWLEQCGVEIRKILELQPRNLLSDKVFNHLQRLYFRAIHQCEGVAHILGSAGAANAVNVIFR